MLPTRTRSGRSGCIWPMQPRSAPRLRSVTNTPCGLSSDGEKPRASGTVPVSSERLIVSRASASICFLSAGVGGSATAAGACGATSAGVGTRFAHREHDGAVAHHAIGLADREVAGVRVAHHACPAWRPAHERPPSRPSPGPRRRRTSRGWAHLAATRRPRTVTRSGSRLAIASSVRRSAETASFQDG